jgi:6-phosphogluconate dehydrogenase
MNTTPTPVIAMIGLGRMGANLARRLARAGFPVTGYDAAPEARAALASEPGITIASSLAATVAALKAPRAVWVMLPAGTITEQTVQELASTLSPGDVILEGGNSDYRESMRRASWLAGRGIEFVDVGVSGGVWGLDNGYGLMFGGSDAAIGPLLPLFRALAPAPDKGWVHCGPVGSGHFAKMIHNGIEYGMMQAYAEGFALLRAKHEFASDIGAILEAWRHGTVVRSWLLDLAAEALQHGPPLEQIAPVVADSGEGRWTVRESIDLGIPAPVITAALQSRFASQGHADDASRFLAQLRNAFGGHAVQQAGKPK